MTYSLKHVTRMSDNRHPKKLSFGWLPKKCPAHGAKLCWRDKVRQDLKKYGNHHSIRKLRIVSDVYM